MNAQATERTTIMASPLTMLRARDFAKRSKRTLSSVVNDALERYLEEAQVPLEKQGFPYEALFSSGHPEENASTRVDELLGEMFDERDRQRRDPTR